VAHHEDRLPFSLCTQVAQRVLRRAGTRELAAGTRSYRRHRGTDSAMMGNLYHKEKNHVKVCMPWEKESLCLS
jgi:hypothetical protein